MSERYDVIGIGNAIVDVLARAEDDFLVKHGMAKGSMALIDEARAEAIYAAMGPAIEISGGSAANTIVGVASFGGKAAFIGTVKDDTLGGVFTHDIRAAGVSFSTPPFKNGPSTARSYILVTPDGERTMNTYLGAAQLLSAAEVAEAEIAAAKVTYLEGYLWDPQNAKDAFVKAAKIAHQAKRTVALTLSDAFCVDRYRDEFRALVKNGTVDLLFANESELKSLYRNRRFRQRRRGAPQASEARGRHAQRKGRARGDTRQNRGGRCISGRKRSSIRPAPAISSRRDFSTASRADSRIRPRRGSARWRRPK